MTKVIARFRLQAPLTDQQLDRLADVRGVYGILRFETDETGQSLSVEYDATRMKAEEVAGLLHRAGVPVVRE